MRIELEVSNTIPYPCSTVECPTQILQRIKKCPTQVSGFYENKNLVGLTKTYFTSDFRLGTKLNEIKMHLPHA